ncbi:MAG: fructose-specific PTS transporter subunit EIIC [Schleiferilactobacillus perolens]|jgi:PTS system fructose-specific IIC component|uniref:Fructose-specific phosphotransferase system, enzyme IIABC n=1 Tax=Schleiferilactobacillus perolens DSM 12744 TaxID=1423792 RepID=A0A0R1MQ03_9LACO|nr:fructose-specific PTS transporter subunit EIIC [Schleiferilactobacillus perolens]KRL09980.1 fructose-specific phosphotransferase system, enzyme IIABC [Schleiferilactobacillus perolens DSM 12744]MCI1891422.1 fructose-specific PTS transporter subunit EIIC [Schleiferilactobacillus harbinensis]MCI1912520.1 fructose-specific PTS transporter subunit EIIC [Schleiferilactobacillus harbinensis]
MKIQDLLIKDAMILDLKATTKEGAIDEMIDRYAKVGVITDKADYKAHILKREAESTTGIGDGIAMPHAKTDSVKRAAVLFAKSNQGVDFDALDKQPVHLFFMIAAPAGANNEHLQALAALSSLLINPALVASLKKATTADQVIELFNDAEAKKEAEDAKDEAEAAATQAAVGTANTASATTSAAPKPYVVAVTACPTGIAHTYMAEAALKEEAKKMGVNIKVETNGSEGIKHRLTADDINNAVGVIVAADKKVAMDRFSGKHLINRPVIDGINKPHELIADTLAEKGPIFHGSGDESAAGADEDDEKQSLGHQVYTSLMNGISNMLPFVVGGGIIMALSFLLERIPGVGANSLIFTFTNGLGSAAFNFLVPILAAYIAEAIGDRPALLPGFVAGWMANNVGFSVIASKNGVAGFLGGLVGGFLAGLTILVLKKWFKNLPKSLDGLKPVFIFPILSLLAIGLMMYFIINPIFTAINLTLIGFLEGMGTTNAVLVGTLLGGMMAIDMGGPFNKAAYVFSIGVFTASKQTDGRWMAAVMAGGMVPPLAIALATTIWPKKWTQAERTSGLSDYLLGLSFITEGAIPFAAADPLRVITSSIIGSAVAGGLTQLMGVNVPAPHGGIFASLLANKPLQFILAVVVGSVISGVILGLWKKDRPDNGLDEAKA